MAIYLFGLNEITWEIIDNPSWSKTEIVEVIVNRAFFDPNKNVPIKVNILEELMLSQDDEIINCVGYKSLQARKIIAAEIAKVAKVKTYISPSAKISSLASISNGVVILGNAVIERGAIIEEGSIIWGGAYICHDSVVGPFNFIASGVRIGGWAKTGEQCKFGFNSAVEQHANVPDNFSAGALNFYKRTFK
jgi:UDP-3-O-[3-hydroxymyristoyl] glucosamine N-acyltransferase